LFIIIGSVNTVIPILVFGWWPGLAVGAVFGVPGIVWGFISRRRREKNKTRPVVIIDDAGLWLRSVGELIPWSEVQSLERKYTKDGDYIVVVYKDQPHSFGVCLMDTDGRRWLTKSIYKETKAYWERNRRASSVSDESNGHR
jgi:hypothetical protein